MDKLPHDPPHDTIYLALLQWRERKIESCVTLQMVVRARTKFATPFGFFMRQYMGWQGVKDINTVGKVYCKSLTNKELHTYKYNCDRIFFEGHGCDQLI